GGSICKGWAGEIVVVLEEGPASVLVDLLGWDDEEEGGGGSGVEGPSSSTSSSADCICFPFRLFFHVGSSPVSSRTRSRLVSQRCLRDRGRSSLFSTCLVRNCSPSSQGFFSAKTANSRRKVSAGHLG